MDENTIWSRLFVNNKDANNFYDALSMKVHDPLWMLSRQWQSGEFNSENNGSPIFARSEGHYTKLKNIGLGNTSHKLENQPLESFVEGSSIEPNLQTKIEMGRHWLRLLGQNQISKSKTIINKSRALFGFAMPASSSINERITNANMLSNKEYLHLINLAIKTKMIDGWKIYHELNNYSINKIFELGYSPMPTQLVALKKEFMDWYKNTYSQYLNNTDLAWNNSRNEYDFKLDYGNKTLESSEYHHDEIGWYVFDSKDEILDDSDNSSEELVRFSIPSNVHFPGMPVSRLWEFEDRVLNFSRLKSSITNLPMLSFIQFGLVYGNDWFTMPLGQIPNGSLLDLTGIVITDSFGFDTKIKHYVHGKNSKDWSFFSLQGNEKESVFLLPFSSVQNISGKHVESINFLRDEMANLAWGIEKIVPDLVLGGKDGDENASAILALYAENRSSKKTSDNIENDSQIKYHLATEVPLNWIPFRPVIKDKTVDKFEILLRRASMPFVINYNGTLNINKVRPSSPLLRNNFINNKPTKPLDIHEEEIPRSGSYVNGKWQRTRGYNGAVYLWYGYNKTNGRGEENSGLRFDAILPK